MSFRKYGRIVLPATVLALAAMACQLGGYKPGTVQQTEVAGTKTAASPTPQETATPNIVADLNRMKAEATYRKQTEEAIAQMNHGTFTPTATRPTNTPTQMPTNTEAPRPATPTIPIIPTPTYSPYHFLPGEATPTTHPFETGSNSYLGYFNFTDLETQYQANSVDIYWFPENTKDFVEPGTDGTVQIGLPGNGNITTYMQISTNGKVCEYKLENINEDPQGPVTHVAILNTKNVNLDGTVSAPSPYDELVYPIQSNLRPYFEYCGGSFNHDAIIKMGTSPFSDN